MLLAEVLIQETTGLSLYTGLSGGAVYTACSCRCVHTVMHMRRQTHTKRDILSIRPSAHLCCFLSQLQSILISLVKGQYRPPVQVMYSRDSVTGGEERNQRRSTVMCKDK